MPLRALARYSTPVAIGDKSALVLGLGGLGGAALGVLGAAGVGRLLVADPEPVAPVDLSRQPLLLEADVGRRRDEAVVERLRALRPDAAVGPADLPADAAAAERIFRTVDVVVDAQEGFGPRFLANDAAVAAGRPLVHGAVLRTCAHLLSVVPGPAGCLRCLFEGPPAVGEVPSVEEVGLFTPLAGVAGALAGAEALRLLLGERGTYVGRLLVFEALTARGRLVMLRRRSSCPACGGSREAA